MSWDSLKMGWLIFMLTSFGCTSARSLHFRNSFHAHSTTEDYKSVLFKNMAYIYRVMHEHIPIENFKEPSSPVFATNHSLPRERKDINVSSVNTRRLDYNSENVVNNEDFKVTDVDKISKLNLVKLNNKSYKNTTKKYKLLLPFTYSTISGSKDFQIMSGLRRESFYIKKKFKLLQNDQQTAEAERNAQFSTMKQDEEKNKIYATHSVPNLFSTSYATIYAQNLKTLSDGTKENVNGHLENVIHLMKIPNKSGSAYRNIQMTGDAQTKSNAGVKNDVISIIPVRKVPIEMKGNGTINKYNDIKIKTTNKEKGLNISEVNTPDSKLNSIIYNSIAVNSTHLNNIEHQKDMSNKIINKEALLQESNTKRNTGKNLSNDLSKIIITTETITDHVKIDTYTNAGYITAKETLITPTLKTGIFINKIIQNRKERAVMDDLKSKRVEGLSLFYIKARNIAEYLYNFSASHMAIPITIVTVFILSVITVAVRLTRRRNKCRLQDEVEPLLSGDNQSNMSENDADFKKHMNKSRKNDGKSKVNRKGSKSCAKPHLHFRRHLKEDNNEFFSIGSDSSSSSFSSYGQLEHMKGKNKSMSPNNITSMINETKSGFLKDEKRVKSSNPFSKLVKLHKNLSGRSGNVSYSVGRKFFAGNFNDQNEQQCHQNLFPVEENGIVEFTKGINFPGIDAKASIQDLTQSNICTSERHVDNMDSVGNCGKWDQMKREQFDANNPFYNTSE